MVQRQWRARIAVGAAVVALVAGAGACGGDDDGGDDDAAGTTEGGATDTTAGSGSAGGDAVTYEVTEIAYTDVDAPAGGSIEIVNSSGVPHTFTADDGAFDAEYGGDETVTVEAPAEAGEYPFHCEIHSSMTATLTVS